MNRSFLLSALVLALAAAMPACGGGDGPKDPTDEKKDEASSGDPIADLKATADGLQKEVEDLFAPIKNAEAVIDGVAKLPADLKAKVKGKIDTKKLMAEAQKIVGGGEFNIDALGLEGEGKALVGERFGKLKELVQSIKDLPAKVEALPGKIADAVKKVATTAPVAIGKAKAKMSMPFGVSDADKKKAQEDIATLEGVMKSFPEKADGWKKDITEIPPKAQALPEKMKAAFK